MPKAPINNVELMLRIAVALRQLNVLHESANEWRFEDQRRLSNTMPCEVMRWARELVATVTKISRRLSILGVETFVYRKSQPAPTGAG